MPTIAPLVLNNGTAAKTYSVSFAKGEGYDVAFRDLSVTVPSCQPSVTVKATTTDVRRTHREKVTFPVAGVDSLGRTTKVGVVEVDIQLRADLVATESEVKAALATALNSLASDQAVLGNWWYKGEALY